MITGNKKSEYLAKMVSKLIPESISRDLEERLEKLRNSYKIDRGEFDFVNNLLAVFVKIYCPVITIEINNNKGISTLSLKEYLDENSKIISFDKTSIHNKSKFFMKEEDFSGKSLTHFSDNIESTENFLRYNDIFINADLIVINTSDKNEFENLLNNFGKIKFERYPIMIVSYPQNDDFKNIWEKIKNPKVDISCFNDKNGIGIIEWLPLPKNLEDLPEELRFNKLHVGCGQQKIAGFINMDVRPTSATDLIHNCVNFSDFPSSYFTDVFSHAFFEHLWADEEEICLLEIHRMLKIEGKVIFLGIPDFRQISRAYLNESIGLTWNKFDLFQVYRLTHGLPEQSSDSWKNEQLHKSIFDKERIEDLLNAAGFKSYSIFNYCFRTEKVPVNLGFVTFKEKRTLCGDMEWVKNSIAELTKDVNLDTLKFISILS